jgi:hypothetical protein
MENSQFKISTIQGKLIGLSDIRKIKNAERELQVSQATFLIETSNGLKKGVMFLWDSDAPRIRELTIGSLYEFSAIVKVNINYMIIFFLPGLTRFRVLVNQRKIE